MPNCRSPRGRRCVPVRRSRLVAGRALPQNDTWRGWVVGLHAAEHLRALFPDFYAAHIGPRPASVSGMLGAVQAFLSLASQKVELLLADELDVNPANPLAVLDPRCDDEDALLTVAEYAGRDIAEIWPLVYGLDAFDEGVATFGSRPHLLAALCTILAADTAWSPAFVALEDLVPAMQRELYQCRVDPALIALLGEIPHLPADLPMGPFCAALDAQGLFAGCALGAIVRYCLHATDNQFADLTYDVVAQMASSGLDWREEDLDLIGAQQRAAARLADQYDALNAQLLDDAALAAAFLARVTAAAVAITAQSAAPGHAPAADADLAALQDPANLGNRVTMPQIQPTPPCRTDTESGCRAPTEHVQAGLDHPTEEPDDTH